ncbi:prolyl oligopeptidase family serine peptidase [Streptomyces sp. NPDC102437]|uniref:alpha/beta hydrolase family protein n=1 Tax=Streptomyces sp. NPDC102437 TaxID=3366175 RepID=UPI003812D5AA
MCTAARTTPVPRTPTRSTSTTRNWPRGAGRSSRSTSAPATATARRSTPPPWAPGGKTDEQDVLQPVAALVEEGLVDPERIALTGYSYGGYLSCWLSTRTDRFAAVVPGGVLVDPKSMAGTSEEGHLITEHEIGDPARMTELSPLSHADNVALAALPGFTLPGDTSASDRYYRTDITEPFTLRDGHLDVPRGPGIGTSPIPGQLAEVTESTEWIGR